MGSPEALPVAAVRACTRSEEEEEEEEEGEQAALKSKTLTRFCKMTPYRKL
jgi:hypothetical protein